MRIKLKVDLPISAKHGCTAGKEFEVTRQDKHKVFFVAADGSEAAAFSSEYNVVKDK